MLLKIYSDGASRGNLGPSAAAFLVLDDHGEVLHSSARFLGERTNNQAEYEALVSALDYVSDLSFEEVACYLDSELVVNQVNGKYRVRNPELKKLWVKVENVKRRFAKISFIHVRRTNKYVEEVDAMVNRTLDRAS